LVTDVLPGLPAIIKVVRSWMDNLYVGYDDSSLSEENRDVFGKIADQWKEYILDAVQGLRLAPVEGIYAFIDVMEAPDGEADRNWKVNPDDQAVDPLFTNFVFSSDAFARLFLVPIDVLEKPHFATTDLSNAPLPMDIPARRTRSRSQVKVAAPPSRGELRRLPDVQLAAPAAQAEPQPTPVAEEPLPPPPAPPTETQPLEEPTRTSPFLVPESQLPELQAQPQPPAAAAQEPSLVVPPLRSLPLSEGPIATEVVDISDDHWNIFDDQSDPPPPPVPTEQVEEVPPAELRFDTQIPPKPARVWTAARAATPAPTARLPDLSLLPDDHTGILADYTGASASSGPPPQPAVPTPVVPGAKPKVKSNKKVTILFPDDP